MRFLASLSILALVAAVPAVGAEPAPRLYHLDATPRLPATGWQAVPAAVEEYVVHLDPELVAANPATVTLDLPTGETVEAVRTRFVEYRPDWKSWFGTVTGPAGEIGSVYLGYHGEQLTAFLEHRGERFRIVGGLEGSHRLVRLSADLAPALCGTEAELEAAAPTEPFEPVGPRPAVAASRAPAEDGFTVAASTRIDVLAVYPKAFFSFPTSEVGVINFVEDSIALANNAFTNSNVNAYYNLVYTGPITGTQPPSTGLVDAIDWLNTDPPEIVDLRNAFGADVVAIFIPYIWDADPYCGIANLPTGTGRITGSTQLFGDRAFSANRDGCGFDDFTLAHEIGHNYGMRHDTGSTSGTHLFPYGRGHLLSVSGTTKASLMGCYCPSGCSASSAAVCNRIAHFSDPAINYLGVPTGTSTRNNANVGRSQVGPYAAFRPVSSNTPPNASFTVSCSGRTCTFDASASTDNAAIPSSGYWWDFGDGTTGSGKVVSHTYGGSGTFYWVHLVVTDSGGQQDFTLDSASPN